MTITLINVLQFPVYFVSLYFSVFWLLVYLEDRQVDKQKRLRTLPTVTIAVPAYNEENTIAKTLDSILNIDYPKKNLQVLVINDGSQDRTQERVKPYLKHKHITLINQENKGKGAAMNEALRNATGEYFVCLDADSEVHPKTLKQLLRHFTEDDIAAVIPVMKIKNDVKLNLLQKLQWYEYLVNVWFKKVMGALDCVHVAPGPFSTYRKDKVIAVGGFAEDNITEDLEMTLRLQRHNYRIVQSMKGEVYTGAMPTLKTYLKQRNRWFKGGVINAYKYNDMMFNPRWGDFGVMQLPILVISGIISVTLIGTLLWDLFSPIIKHTLQMGLVSFDFMTFIRTWTFDTKLIDLSAASVILLGLMLLFSVAFLRLSTHYTNEKLFTYNPFIVCTYLFFYFFLLALTWAVVIKDLALGRVQRW